MTLYPADLSPFMIVAEATSQPTGIDWLTPEGQLIISTYLLTAVTVTATIIEIYRLVKIENRLKLITRLLAVIAQPLRLRRIKAHRVERKIIREGHEHTVPAPKAMQDHEEALKIKSDVVNNEGRYF